MIEGLRPYAEMVATGLPWLPSLPAHWDVRRNGRLFGERRETGYPDLPVLEVSIRTGVRVRDFEGGTRKQEIADRSKYQRAVHGDIAYNMMRMWQGAVGIAPADGLVSPAYVVAKPFTEVDAAYYAYLFRTDGYKHEIDAFSRGIVPDRNRLYWEAFKQMPSAYPPLDEQRLIVRFLDWHGCMTARLIRAQQGILKLVAERREAVTQEALNAPETEHYRFGRVAEKLFREVDRGAASDFVTVGLFNRGRGIFHKEALSSADLGDSTFSWINAGDLIFSGQFAWEGAVALASERDAGRIASHRYHIVRGNPKIVDNTYLWCLFRSSYGEMLLNEHSRGAAGRNRPLNANYLMKEIIPVPSLGQQRRLKEIVDFERQIAQRIADLVRRLQEFRTRLIADVVTGQLDVRALAATLPAVTTAAPPGEPDGDAFDEDADALEDEEAYA